MNNDYNRSPQEVLEELGSCPTGLTEQQAAERLAKYGPNKLQVRAGMTVCHAAPRGAAELLPHSVCAILIVCTPIVKVKTVQNVLIFRQRLRRRRGRRNTCTGASARQSR